MRPKVWGPAMWRILHGTAHARDIDVAAMFVDALGDALPCIHCRTSFREFTERLPLRTYLRTGGSYAYWLYTVHNMVNDKLNAQKLVSCTDPVVFRRLTPSYVDVQRTVEAYAPLCEPRDITIALVCIALNACDASRHEAFVRFVPALGALLVSAEVHVGIGAALLSWQPATGADFMTQARHVASAVGSADAGIVDRLWHLAKSPS